MSEATKRMKANRSLDGQGCGVCSEAVRFGQDVAVCSDCGALQHGPCWDRRAGCSNADCVNAPLAQMAPAGAGGAAALKAGQIACPHCGFAYSQSRAFCPKCKRTQSETGEYTGAKRNAPGAVSSLVAGIVSLFICGVLLGPYAIQQSNAANKAIAADPRLGGSGLALAGKILGIVGLIGWALVLFLKVANA